MSTIRQMTALEERHAWLLVEWFRASAAGDTAAAARIDREMGKIEARLGQEKERDGREKSTD